MATEMKFLSDLGLFSMIQRPRGEHILQSAWSFNCRKYLDGRLRKHKARFCVRGSHQVNDVDVFDTYPHVVSWSMIILLLLLVLVLNIYAQYVDYTNTFCPPTPVHLVKPVRSPLRNRLFRPRHTFAFVGRVPHAQNQKNQLANYRANSWMKTSFENLA